MRKSVLPKHNLITACLIALAAWALLLIFTGFRFVYSTSDDYIMSLLFSNGERISLFMGCFLTNAMVSLSSIAPSVNWFSVFQLVGCFVSVVVINYVFFCKYPKNQALLVAAGFDLIILYTCAVLIQWTHTSTILAVSGWAAVINALIYEKRTRYRILQIAYGVAALFLCTELRFVSFELSALYAALFLFCSWLRRLSDIKNEGNRNIKSAVKALPEYIVPCIVCLVLAVTMFGVNILSSSLRAGNESYNIHRSYNTARVNVTDYSVAPYEGNEKFYNSVGVYSQEALDLNFMWNMDKDFFTEKKLDRIEAYSEKAGYGKGNMHVTMKGIFGTKAMLAMAAAAAFAVIAFVSLLLYRFRRRIKRVFPFVMIVIWAAFFAAAKISDVSLLAIPLAVFAIYTTFRESEHQFVNCLFFSASTIILYGYLSFSRISFRASYTFFVPAIVFLLIIIGDRGLSEPKVSARKTAGVSIALCLLTVVVTDIPFYCYHIGTHPMSFDSQLRDYVKSTPETTYLYNYQVYEHLDPAYVYPLDRPDYPDNTLMYGDWHMLTDYYDKELKTKGIGKLFADMKDSGDKRFIFLNDDRDRVCEKMIVYFNNTYADKGSRIEFVKEKSLKYVSIYKVVSAKK